MWLFPEFTSGDMATCYLKSSKKEDDIIVTSLYLDITNDSVWPPLLGKLLNYCQVNNKEIVILADTNAHSTLWNCNETNKRGEIMEEHIILHNLCIMNIGNHYTFYNRRARTIIDVTMCSNSLADRITDWRVSDAITSSDHLLIEFNLTISDNTVRKARNFRLGDWNSFQIAMEKRDFFLPQTWTYQSLAMESSRFIKDVQNASRCIAPTQGNQKQDTPTTMVG